MSLALPVFIVSMPVEEKKRVDSEESPCRIMRGEPWGSNGGGNLLRNHRCKRHESTLPPTAARRCDSHASDVQAMRQECGATLSASCGVPQAARHLAASRRLHRWRPAVAAVHLHILACLLACSQGAKVTRLAPSNGPTMGGADIYFYGDELGVDTNPDTGSRPQARIGGTACSRTVWMSESAIICRMYVLDGGVGTSSPVVLTVVTGVGGVIRLDDYPTEVEPFFTYNTLTVSQARPFNGPTTAQAGSIVMIGSSFSPVDYSMKARLGVSACESSQWISESAIKCRNSPSVTQYAPMGVTLYGLEISCTQAYSYDRPLLSKVGPVNAGAAGGEPLTIFGKGFGALDPTQDARLHMEAGEFTCLR